MFDLVPSQRRELRDYPLVEWRAAPAHCVDGATKTTAVEQDDGGGDEIEGGCTAGLVFVPAVPETPKTVECDRSGERVLGFSLAEFGGDEPAELGAFLPGAERRLSPQGVSMFALDYYSPWLDSLVPLRDRLGKLEVRYDPRDISHVYIRYPETREFRPVERRDGFLAPVTLWEHEGDRAHRRATNARSDVEKVMLRRRIAEIAGGQKPSKVDLRDAVGSNHAAADAKPYAEVRPSLDLAAILPAVPRRRYGHLTFAAGGGWRSTSPAGCTAAGYVTVARPAAAASRHLISRA